MRNQTTSVATTEKHYDQSSSSYSIEPELKLHFKNKPKVFNPYNAKMMTLAITDNKIESYYNQIKNNLYMGALAYWYVARDLSQGKAKLKPTAFKQLTSDLKMTENTVNRYIQIAESHRCLTLFKDNNLPESWTTALEIIKLGKKDFDKLMDWDGLDSTTTLTTIKQVVAKGKKKKKKPEQMIIPFAVVSIDKSQMQTGTLKNFEKSFTKFVNSQKETVSFVIDKNVEKRVKSFHNKLTSTKDKSKKKSAKSRKNKELN